MWKSLRTLRAAIGNSSALIDAVDVKNEYEHVRKSQSEGMSDVKKNRLLMDAPTTESRRKKDCYFDLFRNKYKNTSDGRK